MALAVRATAPVGGWFRTHAKNDVSVVPAAAGAWRIRRRISSNGAISLQDAISKQLGLKLEKRQRPVPVLVIDHIEEKPAEN
jgi:uncharacterized protein (TIGR03435 family)